MDKTLSPNWNNAPAGATHALKLKTGQWVFSMEPSEFVMTAGEFPSKIPVTMVAVRSVVNTVVQCGRGEGTRYEIEGVEMTRDEVINLLIENGVIDKNPRNQPKPILVTWTTKDIKTALG